MDRLAIISEIYGQILHTFSLKTVEHLKSHLLFKVMMPAVSDFLQENVEKEIRKDRLAIILVFDAYERDKRVSDEEFNEILKRTKEIDKEFIQKTGPLPVRIHIPYSEINRIRKKRLHLLAGFICEILNNWEDGEEIFSVIRRAYKREEFRRTLFQILHLYNLETERIARSMKMPLFLESAKDSFIKALYEAMEASAKAISGDITERIFTDYSS